MARTSKPAPTPLERTLAALRAAATKSHLDGLARFAIPSTHALGVPMKEVQRIAKAAGTDHGLAAALWDTGIHEARLAVAYIADPALLTVEEMDRWCAQFDNWAVCDTLCFALFDRSPHAFDRVTAWAVREEEFVKRAAFALLAGLALHRKTEIAAELATHLATCEAAATDARNFVKKGVSWAIRSIGQRDAALHRKACAVGKRLQKRDEAPARWIGKDVLADLERPLVAKKLAARAAKPAKQRRK